ncbi:lyase family protein [Rhodococcus sp. G-MC3]|uniref:lyase family protein n=1 Tax=Rhodococcus sp. G-MC3 TaxID=3046209 RepID=UPI0024B8C724|nr:lyase family protein [Rhodococcus sp. G-MC3]MDJ0394489.1 lyase family protein [Rhodococcus sp. G-MC3]
MTATRGSLFDSTFGAGVVAAHVSDQAWVTAMLDVEAALTRSAAAHGLVDVEHAVIVTEVASELALPGSLDIAELGAASVAGGNPVIPLVGILRRAVSVRGVPAGAVHPGATSQDILDTASMLLTRSALSDLVGYLDDAISACTALARRHRDTPTAGRTLGQQALPTTFGAVAAGWTMGLVRARESVHRVIPCLAIQLGGAAGTSAALHPLGLLVADSLADELGLARQDIPWHTDRTRIADIVGALGTAAGAVAKPALDITLLAATEVGEVEEDAPGGSSAMPHKRNPVAAVTARAAVRRVPGLVATMLSSMEHEHQRAAGSWHAEWETLTDLLRLVTGGAHQLAVSLTGLHVNADAMARNLDITHGLLLAERVTSALSSHTDRARDIVTAACSSGVALDQDPAITEFLDSAEIRVLLDPSQYLGHSGDIVDRVLDIAAPRTEGSS